MSSCSLRHRGVYYTRQQLKAACSLILGYDYDTGREVDIPTRVADNLKRKGLARIKDGELVITSEGVALIRVMSKRSHELRLEGD